MNPALPYELTQAQIADLHRQAERGRIARRTRRARHGNAAPVRRPAVLPRVGALLTGRAPRSAN